MNVDGPIQQIEIIQERKDHGPCAFVVCNQKVIVINIRKK